MNLFNFSKDTIGELKPGDVFMFYESKDGIWNAKLMIFQGFAPGHAIRLCFNAGDQSSSEAPDLDTMSRKTAIKLMPDQHPEVVQSGLSYVFSA